MARESRRGQKLIMPTVGERRAGASNGKPVETRRRFKEWIGQFAFDMRTVDAIRSRAPIGAPLLVVAAANVTMALFMWPLFSETLARDSQAIIGFVAFLFWLTAVFSPVLVLTRVLPLAVTGWSVAAVVGERVHVRHLVSVLLFGEVLLLIRGALDLVVLHLRRLSGPLNPADLVVRWGLDLVIDARSPVGVAILQDTSIFHLLWMAFLYKALSSGADLSRASAFVVTGGLWTALVGLDVVRAIWLS